MKRKNGSLKKGRRVALRMWAWKGGGIVACERHYGHLKIDGGRRSQIWSCFFLYNPPNFLIFLQFDFNLTVQPHFFQHLCDCLRHHPTLRIIAILHCEHKSYSVCNYCSPLFFLSVYTILKFWEIFENSTKLVVSIFPKSNTNQLW